MTANHTVTLNDEGPLIIAYLIIWLYTGHYQETGSEESQLSIEKMMSSGRRALSDSCGLFVPESEGEITEPDSLHAQIYLVADKYGIEDLKKSAIDEIEAQLPGDRTALLPSLQHLFLASVLVPSTPNSSNDTGNIATSSKRSISEKQDPKLWTILVKTTSDMYLLYRSESVLKEVMLANPQFQWAVLWRVADQLAQKQEELDKLQKADLPPPPKKRKYTKNKTQTQTQTQAQTKSQAKPQTKPQTKPQIKPQTKPPTQASTQMSTKEKDKDAEETETQSEPRFDVVDFFTTFSMTLNSRRSWRR